MMWFVLFALSPCSVKKFLLNVVESEYNQPLNKSRTTFPTNSCQYSQNEIRQNTVIKQSENKVQIEPVDYSVRKKISVRVVNIRNSYSKTFSGNSPPKYILFKRLKLDLA